VRYESAIKKLFPRGGYWDEQFADPTGDVSLFAKAKMDELLRFRGRMSGLRDESRIETAGELIDDWERVLLGKITYGKTLTERRLLLGSKEDNTLNRMELQKTADIYGLSITDVSFPYRPGFFGFSRFNQRVGGPAGFSVLLVVASLDRAGFRTLFAADHPVQRFGTMRFSRDRLACFPVYRLYYYLEKALRAASMGSFKFGIQRLFPLFEISNFERKIIKENKFLPRFEKAYINYIARGKKLFHDFEMAVRDRAFASQILFFEYEGV
jgi:uncharacterized protein YmfQ (DUF2313 family)